MIKKNNIFYLFVLLLITPVSLISQNIYTYLNRDYNRNIEQEAYSSKTRFHTSVQSWKVGRLEQVTNYDSVKQLYRLDRTIEKKWKQKAWDKFLNDDIITLIPEKFLVCGQPADEFRCWL